MQPQPPEGQPAPQPQAWTPPPPIVSNRPGTVTAAAIILIIFGVLFALFGLLFMLAGALFPALRDSPELSGQFGSLPPSFGVFVLVVGAVLAVWGALEIVAAIFVLSGRTWARITAMVLAILGALISLASVIPGPNGVSPVGAVISGLFVAGHAFAIWALASNGRWFASSAGAA